jgi:arylsulfatase A
MSLGTTLDSVGQWDWIGQPFSAGTKMVLTGLTVAAIAMTTAMAAIDRHPNIVVIVSDDQGYHDLGCYGSDEVIAPNLDQLAAAGVRLTDFYVTWPACTPSRGSLLTGRYPQRNGMYDMVRNEAPDYGKKYTAAEYAVTFERIGGMDTREVLLPRVLHDAGYESGIFGKWDLGIHRRFLPLARGFDDFYGFVNTGIDYYTHERYGVPSMFRNNDLTEKDKGTYCTDLFRREALRFLDEHHAEPFFLYLPFNAPHSASNLDSNIRSGAQAPDEYKAMYPHLKEGTSTGKRYGKPAEVATREARRLRYLASVTAMDKAIGEVLAKLDQYGLTDDTLVIFFSDNGGGGGADNSPLRGGKSKMFEGGIRVPCIVRFPGRIPAGTVCEEFLTSLEIFPTVLRVASVSPPSDVKLDGFDMLPVLAGQKPSQRTEMFWQRRADCAARVGNWKWVDSAAGSGLFNLSTDIAEQHDLSQQEPTTLRMVKERFTQWTREMVQAEPRGPFRDY